ncbi:MAG: hypothetical protein SH868_19410 [Bythopirellula sp.]|nr:hypothetical protein [Bythopirellula sp.]
MPHYDFLWNDEIIDHIAQHGVTPEEFECVVRNPQRLETSESSGLPIAFGPDSAGEIIACVYDVHQEITVIPVTAYRTEEL